MHETSTSRRGFLSLCGAAALAAITVRVLAQAPGKLELSDPLSIALGYVEDVAKLDPAKEAAFKPGSNCGNCTLYVSAQEQGGYAPCGAVGNKLVARAGWCRAWVS